MCAAPVGVVRRQLCGGDGVVAKIKQNTTGSSFPFVLLRRLASSSSSSSSGGAQDERHQLKNFFGFISIYQREKKREEGKLAVFHFLAPFYLLPRFLLLLHLMQRTYKSVSYRAALYRELAGLRLAAIARCSRRKSSIHPSAHCPFVCRAIEG